MKRTNLIGGVVASLVFLFCCFLVYTASSQQNAAKESLQRLAMATKSGVSYAQYKSLLTQAEQVVEEAHSPSYQIVLSHYKLAANWWRVGNENYGQMCAGHYEMGALKSQLTALAGNDTRVEKMSIGCRDVQLYLNLAWEIASKELAEF